MKLSVFSYQFSIRTRAGNSPSFGVRGFFLGAWAPSDEEEAQVRCLEGHS